MFKACTILALLGLSASLSGCFTITTTVVIRSPTNTGTCSGSDDKGGIERRHCTDAFKAANSPDIVNMVCDNP